MSKRAAAVQLTADNAEADEENIDDPGKFEQAPEELLQKRVIKKAVRRGNREMDNSNSSGGGVFASLKGSLAAGASLKGSLAAGAAWTIKMDTATPPADTSGNTPPTVPRPSLSEDHLYQLKSLNISVSEWIGKHVRENPYVDLTPIFRDYTSHLKNIDEKYMCSGSTTCGETESSQCDSEASTSREEEKIEEEDVTTATDHEEESSQTNSASQESQLEPSTDKQQPAGPGGDAADDDGPPALHKTRAKLFYKKGSEFTELGVGTLRVQSSSNHTIHLLLRNDTSLGNVLLNVRVSSEVPMSTMKNNVMIVCPPNPPLGKGEGPGGGAPVTYLVRVKTTQQAENLLKCIKDNVGH